MSKQWFIGCTHFGHESIIKLAGRPYASVGEMNEALVGNWRRVVREEDLVYILGDFSWGDPTPWLDQLPGLKIMILGNHDRRHQWQALALTGRVFAVHEYLKMNVVQPDGSQSTLVLFHYPIEDWDERFRGSIHLHAHTHDHRMAQPSLPWLHGSHLLKPNEFVIGEARTLPEAWPAELVCNRFCVGAEATDYTPVGLDELLRRAGRPRR